MNSVRAIISHFYFIFTFIFIYKNSVAFDIQPNDSSNSRESQHTYENDNNESVASSSYSIGSNPSDSHSSDNGVSDDDSSENDSSSSDSKVFYEEVESQARANKNSDFFDSSKSELRFTSDKLRSRVNIGTQTDLELSNEKLNLKEDKCTQTTIGCIKHLNLAVLKEEVEFSSINEYNKDNLLYDEEENDKYDIYPNNSKSLGLNNIVEYKYNLKTLETISLNEPSSEIFLNDIDKQGVIKRPIQYVDLSKYDVSNEELNKVQIPSNGINFIACDLNSLDIGNFSPQLKRTLSDLYGWVVIRPSINNGKNVIGSVIFGNIGVAINENIKSRIVSFTIRERQQIIKIEEFTSKSKSRVVYFEQTKDTISNKYFSTRRYNQLTVDNWYTNCRYLSFYTRYGTTYHTLDFNSPREYNNVFNVEVRENITTYLPNQTLNIYISNVIFGNVKVLYEMDSIYRAVRCISVGKHYYIEIYTIDSLGRKSHLLYVNKASIDSNNIFTKVKYSRDGSIAYHEMDMLRELYLTPVDLNIPKLIYKGEMWNLKDPISTCKCEQNYINDTILAENLKFCGKCRGLKADNGDKNPKYVDRSSLIHYSYKNYRQFGCIYIYINPKFTYTHRIGKVKVGNSVFPLGSLGFVVSIKISRYNDNKVIIKFIILDGERYNYIGYMLQPDGETLGLVNKYHIYDIKPKWLSLWDSNKSKILVDLHLDNVTCGLIKCAYIHENNQTHYYDSEITLISDIYWRNTLLSDPIGNGRKLAKRNVRVVDMANVRLVTIYSLYLTVTPQPNSKNIIFNNSQQYKYWNVEKQHFLQNYNNTFERISEEYASSKLRGNEMSRGLLFADFSENDSGVEDIFDLVEGSNSVYYKIKPEISPTVKMGSAKVGERTFRHSGIHDIVGIWIQSKMSFPFVSKNKWSNRKISIFINDGFKVMVIEYGEIKRDDGRLEYLSLDPFPSINENIVDIVTSAYEKFLNQIRNLPDEEKMKLVANEMEYECLLLVKLELSKKYKSLAGNFENTGLYQLVLEFVQVLTTEFVQEISNLDNDELASAMTDINIYNAEVNIKINKNLSLNYNN